MSTARFTVPKQRLAELMRKPGGVPAEEALKAAAENLQELRAPCLAELQDLLEAADATFARIGAGFDDAGLAELYETAVKGIGLGEVSGVASIDLALNSFCDLLDHLRTNQRYDREAVGVHLRAWRLLMSADLPAEGCQAVLSGLHKVSALYSAPRPAEA
jgi:hypothetical protein